MPCERFDLTALFCQLCLNSAMSGARMVPGLRPAVWYSPSAFSVCLYRGTQRLAHRFHIAEMHGNMADR